MEASRSARDTSVETLRSKYAPKITRLDERIRTAEQRVAREQTQAQQTQVQSAISIGATVLGALFGRKLVGAGNIGRATTAARGVSRTMQEKQDVARAAESVETLQAQLAELNAECEAEIAALSAAATPSIEMLELTPKKSDITVTRVALAWIEA
jgi:phage host-nuclease inhibitor protein Gam